MGRTRTFGALIAVTTILLLSGCVRFQANLSITSDSTLNGDIVVATAVGTGDNAQEEANDRAQDIEKKLLPDLSGAEGVTRSIYIEDSYAGSRFTLNGTPLEAINSDSDSGSLKLTRNGDTFVFDGDINFTPDSEEDPQEDADESGIEVSITFPGTVTEHNGTLNGNRVFWNTSYEGSLDMHAVANAEPEGPSAWVWVLIVGGIAGIIAVILITYTLMKRREDDLSGHNGHTTST